MDTKVMLNISVNTTVNAGGLLSKMAANNVSIKVVMFAPII